MNRELFWHFLNLESAKLNQKIVLYLELEIVKDDDTPLYRKFKIKESSHILYSEYKELCNSGHLGNLPSLFTSRVANDSDHFIIFSIDRILLTKHLKSESYVGSSELKVLKVIEQMLSEEDENYIKKKNITAEESF
jgi:hypothetical protein